MKDFERRSLPRSVQQAVPVEALWPDGLFLTRRGVYSRCFRFADVNYAAESADRQQEIFQGYCEILNSLDPASEAKITLQNRQADDGCSAREAFLEARRDGLDPLRTEFNDLLQQAAAEDGALEQEKYLTLTHPAESPEAARNYFAGAERQLAAGFAALGSELEPLDAVQRLKSLGRFYRGEEENRLPVDLPGLRRRGEDWRDAICPDSLCFQRDWFSMGNRFGRVLYLRQVASCLTDRFVRDLTEQRWDMLLSLDIRPIPMETAVRRTENILLGIETNISNWQRHQNRRSNYSATVPYDLVQQQSEAKAFLEDLTARDQRMMLTVLTLALTAETYEQLQARTERIRSIAAAHMCQLSALDFRQREGLNTALPAGARCIDLPRTLTTESLAIFLPFRVRDVRQPGGIYYGQNRISGNFILADRTRLLNGNSFILGVSGAGKSFAAKNEILQLMLKTDADILILDPEREYGPLTEALGGEIVRISPDSPNHINAMDMNRNYGEGADPVKRKSQFLMSLLEQARGGENLDARQRSLLDRCAYRVFRNYTAQNCMGDAPTLEDFRRELAAQPEAEAGSLALDLELFTRGSLNTFSQPTNVNTQNRLLCYDILDLGRPLAGIGMLILLDSVFNRITANRSRGRKTYLYIDEIYLLFKNPYSAEFLYTLWKRVRKYGAYACGITQNVTDLLQSQTASAMLSNSEFSILLSQSGDDREKLQNLLAIAPEQMEYLTNAKAGEGILKYGKSMLPFRCRYPKGALYQMLTTKQEDLFPERREKPDAV